MEERQGCNTMKSTHRDREGGAREKKGTRDVEIESRVREGEERARTGTPKGKDEGDGCRQRKGEEERQATET